jgi:putative ABC transport system ATP-binding protein
VGFIFQMYNLLPVLTAYQNVEMPLLLTELTRRERREHVRTALDMVGLTDREDHYPSQLSGGQNQRVAIARALVADPSFLLADEPTGDLDRKSAEDVLHLLEELHHRFDKSIVMVTHDPHAAERADRLVHLEKGVIVPDGKQ